MALSRTAVDLLDNLKRRAQERRPRLVFPEGRDPRVIAAAHKLREEKIADPILLTVCEPDEKYARLYFERRRFKGITEAEAAKDSCEPLLRGALMVAAGDAAGCLGGAVHTTGDTVRSALRAIGLAPGFKLLSSAFLMALPDTRFGVEGLLTFADCAVVIEPDAEQLAEIALAAAHTTRVLLDVDPIVAILSFSTHGSAQHERLDTIRAAVEIARRREPDLVIDGEMQVDAALVEVIGRSKAPSSKVAGHANTLIFPDLASGNIGYKLVERLAGATAIGPILQGLAKPMNDLSRGCSWTDVYHMAILTACQ